MLPQLEGWRVVESHHITRRFEFPTFEGPLALVMRIGGLAEEVNHHPDLAFGWGYVEVKLYTHAIDGLTESDFVLAAKIDELHTE